MQAAVQGRRRKGGALSGRSAACSAADIRHASGHPANQRRGSSVHRLLIEEGVQIAKEFYVGMVIDRNKQRVALLTSSEGGMEIEEVAAHTPEKLHTFWIDPITGLDTTQAGQIAARIGIPASSVNNAATILQDLYRAFVETDALLAEINPLGVNH